MRFSGLSMWWSAVVCAVVALAGCGGDGSTGGGGGQSGGGTNTGASAGSNTGGTGTGGTNPGGTNPGGTNTGATGTGGTTTSGPDFSACEGKFQGQDPACQQCVQDNCAESLVKCCETMGCPEIVTCARESGCSGTDCYFGPNGTDGPCKAVIDAAGGPVSDGVGAAQDFGMCAVPACEADCTPK